MQSVLNALALLGIKIDPAEFKQYEELLNDAVATLNKIHEQNNEILENQKRMMGIVDAENIHTEMKEVK